MANAQRGQNIAATDKNRARTRRLRGDYRRCARSRGRHKVQAVDAATGKPCRRHSGKADAGAVNIDWEGQCECHGGGPRALPSPALASRLG
eukprot:scaffold283768_cov30-Tisochrysis_lutea.AAC.2